MAPTRAGANALQGNLELLILRTLSLSPAHGYAIAQHIGRLSQDVLKVEQGSLYPALERLERDGLVTSEWKRSPTGRHARYYRITRSGRKALGDKLAEYDRISLAIARVLDRA